MCSSFLVAEAQSETYGLRGQSPTPGGSQSFLLDLFEGNGFLVQKPCAGQAVLRLFQPLSSLGRRVCDSDQQLLA